MGQSNYQRAPTIRHRLGNEISHQKITMGLFSERAESSPEKEISLLPLAESGPSCFFSTNRTSCEPKEDYKSQDLTIVQSIPLF